MRMVCCWITPDEWKSVPELLLVRISTLLVMLAYCRLSNREGLPHELRICSLSVLTGSAQAMPYWTLCSAWYNTWEEGAGCTFCNQLHWSSFRVLWAVASSFSLASILDYSALVSLVFFLALQHLRTKQLCHCKAFRALPIWQCLILVGFFKLCNSVRWLKGCISGL